MATTRDALIEAATELLDEGGVASVTLREVGRRAGVSHNAPYKHFADKQALLAAVVARDLQRRSAAGRRASTARTPLEAVRALLHASVRHAQRHPERFRLANSPWPTAVPELADAADTARSAFITAVERAQRAGELPAADPPRLASLLLALAHGASELALAGQLPRAGKSRLNAADLVDDLISNLRS